LVPVTTIPSSSDMRTSTMGKLSAESPSGDRGRTGAAGIELRAGGREHGRAHIHIYIYTPVSNLMAQLC
jgi:hypothetical protein